MCVTGSLSGSPFSFDEKRLIVLAKYDDKTLGMWWMHTVPWTLINVKWTGLQAAKQFQ